MEIIPEEIMERIREGGPPRVGVVYVRLPRDIYDRLMRVRGRLSASRFCVVAVTRAVEEAEAKLRDELNRG